MLETLKLKYFQGKQYIPDIKKAPMREQFRGFPIVKSGTVDESICPTKALCADPLSIDMGKCTFCGACKSEAISFSNYYKLASTDREKLVVTENITIEDYEKLAIKSKKEIWLRHIGFASLIYPNITLSSCLNTAIFSLKSS